MATGSICLCVPGVSFSCILPLSCILLAKTSITIFFVVLSASSSETPSASKACRFSSRYGAKPVEHEDHHKLRLCIICIGPQRRDTDSNESQQHKQTGYNFHD